LINYSQFENFSRDLGFYDDKTATNKLLGEMWLALREIQDGDDEND